MSKTLLAIVAGAVALAFSLMSTVNGGPARAAPEQTGSLGEPVLLELFTSQGCSSCPPADRLSAKLAREPDLVVIARPVTYWDRLGWKDTLAREGNTRLQRDYARQVIAGYNGVYTPQFVVDGKLGEVGSREGRTRRHIALARGAQNAAIRITKAQNGDYGIGLGGEARQPAELWLLAISSQEEVAIGRGENNGRTITYTNVLLDETRIARWNGGQASHILRSNKMLHSRADKYALVLREPNGGNVLAARWVN